jgi:hypothetical protein
MQEELLDHEPGTPQIADDDQRLTYVPPTLATVESKLSALLGSVCQPDPNTGVPDT